MSNMRKVCILSIELIKFPLIILVQYDSGLSPTVGKGGVLGVQTAG